MFINIITWNKLQESTPDMVFNSETNIYFYVTEEERLVDCSEREMKVQDRKSVV